MPEKTPDYRVIPNADGLWAEFTLKGSAIYSIKVHDSGKIQIRDGGAVVSKKAGVLWYGPIPPATGSRILGLIGEWIGV